MRISVSFGFCALVCIMGWLELHATAMFLLCAAIHEAGHLAMLRIRRVPVHSIRLRLSGAVIKMGSCGYQTEVLCAAAGPVASILLGVVCLRCVPELAIISLLLAVVNLLPVYPMDGGRILAGILLLLLPVDRAERVLHIVTFATCSILMVLACWGTVCLQMGLLPMFVALVLLCRGGSMEKQLLFPRKKAKMEEQA